MAMTELCSLSYRVFVPDPYRAGKQYSMIERQTISPYSALQAVEPIAQTSEVIVKKPQPIQRYVKDMTCIPKTG